MRSSNPNPIVDWAFTPKAMNTLSNNSNDPGSPLFAKRFSNKCSFDSFSLFAMAVTKMRKSSTILSVTAASRARHRSRKPKTPRSRNGRKRRGKRRKSGAIEVIATLKVAALRMRTGGARGLDGDHGTEVQGRQMQMFADGLATREEDENLKHTNSLGLAPKNFTT